MGVACICRGCKRVDVSLQWWVYARCSWVYYDKIKQRCVSVSQKGVCVLISIARTGVLGR